MLPLRYVLLLCGCIVVAVGAVPPAMNLYVNSTGRDTWSGRLVAPKSDNTDGPFATLGAARDTIRHLKAAGGLPPGGVTVWIAPGVYPQAESFKLTQADSGTADAPISYQRQGNGEARIFGGVEITKWKPVTDAAILERLDPVARGKVLVADLKAAGITRYGQFMRHDGSDPGEPDPGAMELFWRRRPMTIARWPNDGWAHIADIPVIVPKPTAIQTEPPDNAGDVGAKVFDELNKEDLEATDGMTKTYTVNGWKVVAGKPIPIHGQFTFDGDRPARWKQLDDVWIHGFWMWDWLDSYEQVTAIEVAKRLIITNPPPYVEYCKGRRWYALNILEELDMPGEYYLNRKEGLLYFWPPEPTGETVVSTVGGALVTLDNSSYVTLRGLTLECAQGDGIDILGGAHNRVRGCAIRNIGTVGVRLYGGSDNGVQSCDLYDCASGGVRIKGAVTGDLTDITPERKTLTPGNLFAENNDIHDYQRVKLVACPGITLGGVGNRAEYNYIHDSPHIAVWLFGNDNQVNYNRIERVCRETADAGAIYTGGLDFASLGHQINWNYFAELGGYTSPFHYNAIHAIYLDGYTASGIDVVGNVIIRAPIGIYQGGGRDVTITNNILVGCPIMTSNRGRGNKVDFSTSVTSRMMRQLRAVGYDHPPWSTHYPNLAKLPFDEPGAPLRTCVLRNIIAGMKGGIFVPPKEVIRVADNLTDTDPCFVDAEHGNYQLRDDSPAWKLNFQRIPLEKIGLNEDEDRKALPVQKIGKP